MMKTKIRLLFRIPLIFIGAWCVFYWIAMHTDGDDLEIYVDESVLVYPFPVDGNGAAFDTDGCDNPGKMMQQPAEEVETTKVHVPTWTLW